MDEARPSLEDVLDGAIRGALVGVHTGFVAEVVSYDRTTQTATLQPVVRGRRRTEEGTVEFYALPQLVNVPVEFHSGGGCSITWDLAKGDQGIVRILERSHDEWRTVGGSSTSPQHARRFDLSDATFCPGGRSPSSPLAEVAAGALVIAGADLRLGSATAASPAVLGDLAQKIIQGILDGIATAAPIAPPGGGPVLFSGDPTATSAQYPGAVGLAALTAAIGADVAALLSAKVTLE